MSTSAHAVAPPARAAAPPVQRKAKPMSETQDAPQRLLTSLSSVPAVQRKCAVCAGEENEDQMPVQPRLKVGPVDDPYEREADNIAGKVMAMREPEPASAAGVMVQRACSACSSKMDEVQRVSAGTPELMEDDTETPRMRAMAETTIAVSGVVQRACAACSSKSEEVQRTPADFSESTEDDEQTPQMRARAGSGGEHIAASSSQLTSGGTSLGGPTRDFFESRMGRDLSGVRVHAGGEASTLNGSIRARAFTYKNHVWLGTGESAGPNYTMAHELSHVMQQTAPGPVGPQAWRREDADSEASTSHAVVQRRGKPFWLPSGVQIGKMTRAQTSRMHNAALKAIMKANPDILTEVPIPGGNAKRIGPGVCGFADIYTVKDADTSPAGKVTVPGVEVVSKPAAAKTPAAPAQTGGAKASASATAAPVPAASLSDLNNFSLGHSLTSCTDRIGKAMRQGGSAVSHENRRAPKIENGALVAIASAPIKVRIGEMKPMHDKAYRKSGKKQLENYLTGIWQTASKVNAVAGAKGATWKPTPANIGTDLSLPNGWNASGTLNSSWPIKSIKIRHYKPTRARTKSGRRKLKAKDARQGRPKSQPIRGRWMMAPDNEPGHEGVFVYFLAPNPTDLTTALGPTSTRTEFRRLSGKLEKIKHDLIASPKPVASGAKAQPRRLPAKTTPLPKASAAPARPVRKEVKDNFKASDWEKARTGAGLKSGQKDNSLLGDYAAADNDLRDEIAEKGAMVEWLKAKPATKGTTYTKKREHDKLLGDLKLLKGVDFWTGIKAKPFGILREKFGLFFVKAYQKAVGVANKIREKFKSFKEGKILAGKKGTIVKAAAKVASVVLPRLAKPFLAKMFDTIMQCGITGFEAKFRELIESTFIEDVIETADQLKGKVETLASNVEAYFKGLFKKTVDPIVKEFEQFVSEAKLVLDVVNMVKEITKAIRIGACVVGLASAPETVGIGAVVGCGAALGDYILSKFGLSPVDHLIGTILSSCNMQNKLGKLMAGIGFIKTLPKRAGKAIITQVKALLKDNDTLKGLGSVKGKDFGRHASELFCNPDTLKFPDMGYEKSNCSDTGSYRKSKTGTYDIPDSVRLYKQQKPIPSSELPWKGVEIPTGRKGQLAPMPSDKPTSPSPAPSDTPDPPKKNPAQKGTAGTGSVDTALKRVTSTRKGTVEGVSVNASVKLHLGINPKNPPKVGDKLWAHVSVTTSEHVYGPSPVQITVKLIKHIKGPVYELKFTIAPKTVLRVDYKDENGNVVSWSEFEPNPKRSNTSKNFAEPK